MRALRPDSLLVLVLATGAETSLLYVLESLAAGSPAAAPLPWTALWALGVLAFVVAHSPMPRSRAGRHSLALGLWLLTSLAALYLACYASVPPLSFRWLADLPSALLQRGRLAEANPLVLLVALVLLWWRQGRRDLPDVDTLEPVLSVGAVPVAAAAAVGAVAWSSHPVWTVTLAWHLFAFFLLTLLALAWARYRSQRASRAEGALLGRWLESTLGPAAVVLLVMLAAGAALVPGANPVLHAVLVMLVTALGWVFVAVGAFLGWFLPRALVILVPLFTALGALRVNRLAEGGRGARGSEDNPIVNAVAWIYHHPEVSDWLLGIFAVVVVCLVLLRVRPLLRREGEEGIERDQVTGDRPARRRRRVGSLLRRLYRADGDPLSDMLADPVWRYTAEVRAAYRRVDRELRGGGEGREASQTPLEYAACRDAPALRELTELYDLARYSMQPTTREVAERAHELAEAITARRG